MGDPEPAPAICSSVKRLLQAAGHRVETYAGADHLSWSGRPSGPCCLILDVRLSGMSGLDLQQRLAVTGDAPPIVFISAHADQVARQQALAAGAIAFLRKPFAEAALIDAVRRAFGLPATS